jgi:hypothetical protein
MHFTLRKKYMQRSKFIVLCHELTLFVKHETKCKRCYTEDEVISMLEFVIGNIFVEFGGHIFPQIIGIPIGTNCTIPLPIFSYTPMRLSLSLCNILTKTKHTEDKAFNLTFRYIDDVLSVNNPNFSN